MARSLVRYSAVACVVAGGLFVGGTGAVAFADPPGDGTGVDPTADEGTQTQSTATPRGFRIPKWMRPPGFSNTPGDTPRVGFIAPPLMNLPSRPQPTTAPDRSPTTRQPTTVTLPFVIGNQREPSGREPAGAAVVPDTSSPQGDVTPSNQGNGASETQVDSTPPSQFNATSTPQDTKPAATATRHEPPTIDLTPLVPRAVQGPPLTIENPLRQLLAPDVDFDAPITEQLLPAPLVALLNTVSEQIPLAGLVISPMLEFADVVIPMLLSDIVVPTLPTMSSPTPIPGAQLPMRKPALLARSESPPAELAPMGMDAFQAPVPLQPSPPSVDVEKPQAPPEPPSSDPEVTSLSDPVAYRAGYSDYLRNAGMAQITAIAVPGAAAILLFSLSGGFIGYRQARAGHVIRAEGITRFLR